MVNTERMKVLESPRDLRQLAKKNTVSDESALHRGGGHTHKSRPRCLWMRLDVLDDVTVFTPIVDKGELEQRHVHTVERKNVLVR